jgi:hypothetical protein
MSVECGRPGRLYPASERDRQRLEGGPSSEGFWGASLIARCEEHQPDGVPLAPFFARQSQLCDQVTGDHMPGRYLIAPPGTPVDGPGWQDAPPGWTLTWGLNQPGPPFAVKRDGMLVSDGGAMQGRLTEERERRGELSWAVVWAGAWLAFRVTTATGWHRLTSRNYWASSRCERHEAEYVAWQGRWRGRSR